MIATQCNCKVILTCATKLVLRLFTPLQICSGLIKTFTPKFFALAIACVALSSEVPETIGGHISSPRRFRIMPYTELLRKSSIKELQGNELTFIGN